MTINVNELLKIAENIRTKEKGRLKPLIYYLEVIRPLRASGQNITKEEKEAEKIIKECRIIRKKIFEESGGKVYTHQKYEQYKKLNDVISLAEMWLY